MKYRTPCLIGTRPRPGQTGVTKHAFSTGHNTAKSVMSKSKTISAVKASVPWSPTGIPPIRQVFLYLIFSVRLHPCFHGRTAPCLNTRSSPLIDNGYFALNIKAEEVGFGEAVFAFNCDTTDYAIDQLRQRISNSIWFCLDASRLVYTGADWTQIGHTKTTPLTRSPKLPSLGCSSGFLARHTNVERPGFGLGNCRKLSARLPTTHILRLL